MKEDLRKKGYRRKKEEADKENKKREEEKHEKERQYLQEQNSTIKEKEVKLQKKGEMWKQEHEIGKQLMEDDTDELTWVLLKIACNWSLKQNWWYRWEEQIDKAEKEMGSIRKQWKIVEEKRSRLIDKAAKPSTSSTSGKTCSLVSHSSKGDESKIKMSTVKAHSSIGDKLQKRKKAKWVKWLKQTGKNQSIIIDLHICNVPRTMIMYQAIEAHNKIRDYQP